MCKYLAFKGTPTTTVICKYSTFKGAPPPSPMFKWRKSSNQLLHWKNYGLKLLPKSSEKTTWKDLSNKSKWKRLWKDLSNKSKYLYQMINFYTMIIFYAKWWFLEIEVDLFGLLIILWKYHISTESIQVEQQKKEKGRKNNKQGYICASYHATEMAFLRMWILIFSKNISGVSDGLIWI